MKPSNLSHDSAHLHVTGLSEYVDDRPRLPNEAFVELVLSTEPRASIKAIDADAALRFPGVLGVFTAKDVHHNLWGTIFQDQPLLADGETRFCGEPLALVAALTQEAARAAARLVKVKYAPLPALLSISAAVEAKSFIGSERKIERGGVESALASAPHRLKGKTVLRGADHFYLESQVAAAYPQDDGSVEIHCSSQHPTETQHVVAHALGLPQHQVICIVKRMGGAFGGKESQGAPIAAYAALVASRLRRPARVVLTKDDDMVLTGKRNPFEIAYQVGFDNQGKLLALDARLYSDGGAYADLSTAIMERAMLHIDNAYFIPAVRVVGQVCRTNFHPHTAFRGFGGPKGVATIERILEEVAHKLRLDPLDVRKLNCYTAKGGRNTTHYGQEIENNLLPELFEACERDSSYRARRKEIEAHNEKARLNPGLPLRGLSLTAVKFGISFTTRFLNQANALVLIHRDGTLQVSTGATEMGQGVNARIAEMVADELGLSRDQVKLMPTTTDKNANTSPTAASSGTDLNGAAALLATRKIKRRLSGLLVEILKIPESRWATATAGLGTEKEIEVEELAPNGDDPNLDADWATGSATYLGVRFEGGFVFHDSDPSRTISFSRLVHEAYHQRISLSDYAHYKFPLLSFNKLTGQGRAFLYYTQGVCASEVEVNQETGEVKTRRVDLLMDLGRPVNEGLDMGQVYGGFVQGLGWVTTEKLFYNGKGFLVAHSPSTYKIPNVQDTPRDFRVKLLPNEGNKFNVRGTKASGEPPLLLAISVWTAIHDALKGAAGACYPWMELPAHQEQVLRARWPEKFRQWEGK